VKRFVGLGLLLSLSFALIGCSSGLYIKNSSSEDVNLESFREKVKKRDILLAGKYALIFENSKNLKHQEVLAQYALLTCQPQRALEHIKKIDSAKKTLYSAILYSMLSVKRTDSKKKTPNLSNSNKKKNEATEDSKKIRWQSSEIWADEWVDLKASTKCSKMPLIANEKIRNQGKQLAKDQFDSIPEEWILSDFDILALALDVGYQVKDPVVVLEKFHTHSDSPYYEILKRQITGNGITNFAVHAQKNNEIEMSQLILVDVEMKGHEIEIPILLE
jgi:hypothetical protein